VRILFLGTAQFACPSLQMLLDSSHGVTAVITQPDRPRGRGQKVSASPVKTLAMAHRLVVFQPERIRDPAAIQFCREKKPDVIVVVAYGQILPPDLLTIPPFGCVNVHASLLPKFRGAAPIARAILNGEEKTGVTTMRMDEGMDTGPVFLMEEVPIRLNDTSGTLQDQLSRIGARLLQKTLGGLEDGSLIPRPQDHAQATYAPKISKEEGKIDWQRSAFQLSCQLRAFDPWPGAYTYWKGRVLKLFSPTVVDEETKEPAGTVIQMSDEGMIVTTGKGCLQIAELQLEGRRRMNVREFRKGHSLHPGIHLGD